MPFLSLLTTTLHLRGVPFQRQSPYHPSPSPHPSGSDAPDVTVQQVRSRLTVFVNCLVPNPTFDSQTKDTLVTPLATPGLTATANSAPKTGFVDVPPIPPTVMSEILARTGIVELVVESMLVRNDRENRRKLANITRKTSRKQVCPAIAPCSLTISCAHPGQSAHHRLPLRYPMLLSAVALPGVAPGHREARRREPRRHCAIARVHSHPHRG